MNNWNVLWITVSCCFVCIDINECSGGYHNCSHTCENLPGTHRCLCPTGYILQADEDSCEGTVYMCIVNS